MVEIFPSQYPGHLSRCCASAIAAFFLAPSAERAEHLRKTVAAELRVNETDPLVIEAAAQAVEHGIQKLMGGTPNG